MSKKIVVRGPLAILFILAVVALVIGGCALCFVVLPYVVALFIASGLHCSMWLAIPLAFVVLWLTGILRFTTEKKNS